ncbi:hypothetical protein [Streptomyces sp. NPDC001642]|uniref:hypothetical protein n=1 Tax=Streptomyces sp. NPDC001642 TaxID=3154392 RepID=UPI0033192B1A
MLSKSTAMSPGFWCECWTRHLDDCRPPTLFGSYDAHTEAEANNWVSTILRTISPALDTDTSEEAWERLYDHRVNTRRACCVACPGRCLSPTPGHSSPGL